MTTIGIDIGGTKTALGVVDGTRLVRQKSMPTLSYADAVTEIASVCRTWMADLAVDAVGAACAGPLRPSEGLVLNRDTLPGWFSKPLAHDLKQALDKPAVLLNDADAALLGEVHAGALSGRSAEPAVMLTFGTGVGGAFWDGRRILVGAEEEHPEIGHILCIPGGPECYCGARGCLESLASGTALNEAAKKIGLPGLADLLSAARNGRADAETRIKEASRAIDNALWTLTHAYRPAAFVLGGGVMDAFFDDLAPRQIPVTPSTVLGVPPRVLRASLGNQAGLFGAAFAARDLRAVP